jgi:hypothetical protein
MLYVTPLKKSFPPFFFALARRSLFRTTFSLSGPLPPWTLHSFLTQTLKDIVPTHSNGRWSVSCSVLLFPYFSKRQKCHPSTYSSILLANIFTPMEEVIKLLYRRSHVEQD